MHPKYKFTTSRPAAVVEELGGRKTPAKPKVRKHQRAGAGKAPRSAEAPASLSSGKLPAGSKSKT